MDPTAPLFDADNHYYEPVDCFTRFIEPGFRDRAIHAVVEKGRESIRVGNRPFTFLENVPYRIVSRPGSLREMLRNLSNDDYEASDFREPVSPEFLDRTARLQRMSRWREWGPPPLRSCSARKAVTHGSLMSATAEPTGCAMSASNG